MAVDRIALLLRAIASQPGPEWTTGRVLRLYRSAGIAPNRGTARGDLKRLTARGVLTVRETPGRRFYTPAGGGHDA